MSVNKVKFFHFFADNVIRAGGIGCVSAVKIELNFGRHADSVWFPVVSTAPTPISLLESSVYMCFHPLYLFSKTN